MTYKVIIVDDEKNIRERLEKFFPWDAFNFEVVGTAADGLAAIKLAEETRPDLVFTDIKMAKMDGLQLAEKLYKYFPLVKVVILSAYNDFEYAQKAIAYNVKGYLLKPIMKNDFVELMSKLEKEGFSDRNDQAPKEVAFEAQLIPDGKTKSKYVSFAKKYVNEHYAESISLKDISKEIYIHDAYFSKLFNEEVGEGFNSYVNRIRIEHAKKMLLYTEHQLKDISDMVGFQSHSYFNRVFKNIVGASPLAFRKKHRT